MKQRFQARTTGQISIEDDLDTLFTQRATSSITGEATRASTQCKEANTFDFFAKMATEHRPGPSKTTKTSGTRPNKPEPSHTARHVVAWVHEYSYRLFKSLLHIAICLSLCRHRD